MDLTADVITWVFIVVIMLAMCGAALVAVTQFGVDFREDRLLLIGVMCVPGVIGSLLGYWISGYRVKNDF
ncbi:MULTISPECIES: hypothetical protein [Microbulbifer]|uniref:Uncharacterized protein n=1 Tax=Microbulbifer celer TaxID=435905 RepID=A0ABW3UCQ9_9GAMM|nr:MULTISPECIES: hypothetical protein [Microbulbifer]UFN56378.1 hypothetical protein LPW13_12455 [Microbulbifer celer]